jgi:tetratricopeptide (TPR) repeat protein
VNRWVEQLVLLALAAAFQPVQAQTISMDLDALQLSDAAGARLHRLIAVERWPEAEALLFSLAEAEPSSAPLLEALAAAHLQCGRHLQAATAYLRADRLLPLGPAARFGLAKAYLGMEKRHWARRELERLAKEDPRNPLYPDALAGIFHDYQWFEMAEAQARRAISLAPDFASGHDRLGQTLEGRNQTGEALRIYRIALEKDRKTKQRSPWPAFHLGRLLLEAGQAEEAAIILAEALQIDPNHVDATYERAATLRQLDRWEEALAELERAVALTPTDPRIHYALSQTYRRLGRLDDARDSIRRFRALSAE